MGKKAVWRTGAVRVGVVAAGVFALAVACSRDEQPTGLRQRSPNFAASLMSCDASYTLITNEDDSVMAQYGLPNIQDTSNVCESWSGSDYIAHEQDVGSADNIAGFADTVQGVGYDAGAFSCFDASGNMIDAPQTETTNSFDLLAADQALRDASFDDPFYGIRANGLCKTGGCPLQLRLGEPAPGDSGAAGPVDCGGYIICGPRRSIHSGWRPRGASRTPAMLAVTRLDSSRFRRHGLSRGGVRALVDASEELEGTPEGDRQFRHIAGQDTVIHTLHGRYQLLVREEHRGPGGRSVAKHFWLMLVDGFVRDHSELEDTEQLQGRTVTSRATIRFVNVVVP
jgi:hypothetical protein